MADSADKEKAYEDTLERQKQYFAEQFTCSATPTYYFIHFHNGMAHWSSYSWGWNLSYQNAPDGDPTPCGQTVFRGVAVCKKCYEEKKDDIRKVCSEFDKEVKEKHQSVIDDLIGYGRTIRICKYS